MFPCEFCEIFKNIFFTEHLWMVVSVANLVLAEAATQRCS